MFDYTIVPGGRGQYAYHTDLAHYFPGRKQRGTGDVRPSLKEIERSRRWLETELRLIEPAVVIVLGKTPANVFLERYTGRAIKRLSNVAGIPFQCRVVGRDLPLIPVHHPSGAFQHPSARSGYARAAAHVRQILR
jgi:uracil-DNA glycosylase family 4